MTRGRGGWLALPRTALSSAVSCRFIPTLSVPPTFRRFLPCSWLASPIGSWSLLQLSPQSSVLITHLVAAV